MNKSMAGKLGGMITARKLKKEAVDRYYASPNICKFCGKVIHISENERVSNTRNKVFCNNSCSAKFNNIGRRRHGGKRNCLNCNKETSNAKYCSIECNAEHRWLKKVLNIENGKIYSAFIMKKYLIRKYGEKCLNANCGWDWNVKCIVELEHIDGHSGNNKLENLTLLCPNCHSMTSTYKGKNTGNGRHLRKQRYKDGKSY